MSVLSLGQSYFRKVALSYFAVAVGKPFVACVQVVVAKVEFGANLTIQSCLFTS